MEYAISRTERTPPSFMAPSKDVKNLKIAGVSSTAQIYIRWPKRGTMFSRVMGHVGVCLQFRIRITWEISNKQSVI